jgi:hypothetical protein
VNTPARRLRALIGVVSVAICAPVLAQTTVTLQQGLNGYAGTADTRLMNQDSQEGAAGSFAIINESSTSMAVRFAIFAAEGGPVPNGATIHSATLSLYKYDGPGSSFKASRFLKSWTETGAKWSATGTTDSWGQDGAMSIGADYLSGADGQSTVGASPGWLNIDVTAGVQAFAAGFANRGWKVADNSGTNGGTPRYFRSRDHWAQGERPQLAITYSAAPQSGCNGGALRPYDSAPVNGNPIAVSGAATFEAEHFNCGGEGIAYHDNVAGNAGNAGFRTGESVDIATSAAGNVVNNFQNGEWLTYTINVAQAGLYDLSIRASNNYAPGAFRVEIDGADVTGSVPVAMTGGWDSFQWFTRSGVSLPAGQHVLKLVTEQQYFNLDQIQLAFVSAPPAGCGSGPLRPYDAAPVNGNPISVPAAGATFEAEHFNCGGEGVAYHDKLAGNAGNAGLRTTESVDIHNSGAGPVVNNFETGEWLTYTIHVQQAGSYDLGISASNNMAPASFRFEVDGADTGAVSVPLTGGWDSFQWFSRNGVTLGAGTHVLKLWSQQQYFNVNQVRVVPAGTGPTPPPGLLFRSGFEGTTAIDAPHDCYNNGCWQRIIGTDNGFTWPPQIFGGAHDAAFQARSGGGDPTPSTLSSYVLNEIRPGAGRNGSRALYTEIRADGGSFAQDPYILMPSGEPPNSSLYLSYWIRLQPDMASLMTHHGAWRVLFEWKTAGDYRVSLNIRRPNTSSPLRFEVWADNVANQSPFNQIDYWRVPSAMAVPIGDWFKVEVFWRRSSGSGARTWVAINGQTIADCPNPNVGVNGAPIDRLMAMQLYSDPIYPIYQWVDDFQVWSGFPSATDDPPYGAPQPVNTAACTL